MKSSPTLSLPAPRLRAALTGLGKVVSRKATLPVLDCVRIACDPRKNLATLTATDLDIHFELDLPAQCGSEAGAFLVPLGDLRDALKNGANDDLVTLRSDGDQSVTLVRERGETSLSQPLPSLPVGEFPEGPVITKRAFDLTTGDRDAFLEAMACVSADPTRHVIQGVKLEGGHTFVGTDGRHLYRANSMTLPVKGDVILPAHRLLDWKLLHEDEHWRLSLQGEHFRLSGSTWRLTGKLIDGTYPNWRQVLPRDEAVPKALTLPPAVREHLIGVLKTLPGDKTPNKPVGLRCTREGIELLARGRHEDPFTIVPVQGSYIGEPVTVFVNRDYLGKALSFGLDRIEFGDAMSPVRVREEGSSRREFIVMPVRVLVPEPNPESGGEPAASPDTPEPSMKPSPTQEPQPKPTTTTTTNTNTSTTTPAASRPREHAVEIPALDLASGNLHQLRELLRLVQTELGELANALKQARQEQRNTEREVRQVRSTIRSLQKVEL
jgi:DNA polymerase III sliding clamp (beta) subunit (PCNA family)